MRIKALVVGMIGTNTYVVWDEVSKEAMIIDPADYDNKIDKVIEDNDLNVKYLFLTHGHCDHIAGVPEYKNLFPDAKIVAGSLEVEVLENCQNNHSRDFLGETIMFTPDMTVNEGDTLCLGDIEFNVLETPGHSPGGISLYTKCVDETFCNESISGTAFVGDTLFRGSVGRTDLFKGNMNTLISSINNKLFSLPEDTVVFCGHMGSTTIANEKTTNPFVR